MIKSDKRFLVIGRVGDQSLHKTWIADTTCERTWDLQLNAYGKDESLIQDGDLPPVIDRGTKWDSLVRHFRAQPELLDKYDYIMLPDDDVLMAAKDINRIFEIVVQHDLTMAQPSLNYSSYVSHGILLKCPAFSFRYSNFIETMSACIKTSYLRTLLPMLERHFTGWGSDTIWGLLMDNPAFKVAIIDEVSMTHTRPLFTGPVYKSFPQGIDPGNELHTIVNSFENFPQAKTIYGAVRKDGKKIIGASAQFTNGLYLISHMFASRHPRHLFLTGFKMLVRSITDPGYRPQRLRVKPGAAIAEVLPG